MIAIDTIKQVYSGKDGKCCCGCAGKHSTDQKQKTRIVNILNKDENTKVEETYAFTVIGSRLYVAYFND
jgi:hypothetical protein